jgi:hypothetical protein
MQNSVAAWQPHQIHVYFHFTAITDESCVVSVETDHEIQTVLISTLDGGDLSPLRPGHLNPAGEETPVPTD